MMSRFGSVAFGWIAVLFLLIGCGGQQSSLEKALPDSNEVPGWALSDQAKVFDSESLFDLVNGQADAFFAYDFERVVVQTYENESGDSLRAEIWQLATPADAFGLYTTYRSGTPVTVGNAGDGDPGRRLDFWQERTFVRLFAPKPILDGELAVFASAIADALPSGGEVPSLMGRLPTDGLIEESGIFFHQEISIQNDLWLGGQNALGLGPETNGALARYDVADGTAFLLLIEYPTENVARKGLESLQGGSVSELVLVQASGQLLGAVFGSASQTEASSLLERSFGSE